MVSGKHPMCTSASCSRSDFSAYGNYGDQCDLFLQNQRCHKLQSALFSSRVDRIVSCDYAGKGCITEHFPVYPKLLVVEDSGEHLLFVVLKSVPHLAKNVVQNIAVKLAVMSMRHFLELPPSCTRASEPATVAS